MKLRQGTTLKGGKYHIKKVLGQGGFGITYLASQKIYVEGPIGQIEVEINLAIKEFFMKDICNREEGCQTVSIPSTGSQKVAERFKQKFIKEARHISILQHPNIIKVVDVFEENDTAYYVMEYHDNGSLNSIIKETGAMQESEATRYILQIASALDYIHKEQMNHLDVKPDNVLLNNKGEAVLIDFGLSKCYDSEGEQTSSTPVGVSIGYAPLEQSSVGGVSTFSPATDIYSLGATFYKLLTGQTPPEASEVLDEGLPTMPDSISEKAQNAIIQAMEPRRKRRPQSIKEFLALLDHDSSGYTPIPLENKRANIAEAITLDETVYVEPISPENVELNDILSMPHTENWDSVEAIDLGLSVKWSNTNWNNKPAMWCNMDSDTLSLEDISASELDVVYTSSQKQFRIPTLLEWRELQNKCRWEWICNDSITGYVITGPTGNSIFLPAYGKVIGNMLIGMKQKGYYWTSNKPAERKEAYYIYFDRDIIDSEREPFENVLRYIRPVEASH